MSARLAAGVARALGALRDFLRGFTGLSAAHLPEDDARCVRHALEEQARRRPRCC